MVSGIASDFHENGPIEKEPDDFIDEEYIKNQILGYIKLGRKIYEEGNFGTVTREEKILMIAGLVQQEVIFGDEPEK